MFFLLSGVPPSFSTSRRNSNRRKNQLLALILEIGGRFNVISNLDDFLSPVSIFEIGPSAFKPK